MKKEFTLGQIVTSIKQKNIFYIVNEVNDDSVNCLRLDDMYYYDIPKSDLSFYFSLDLLNSQIKEKNN